MYRHNTKRYNNYYGYQNNYQSYKYKNSIKYFYMFIYSCTLIVIEKNNIKKLKYYGK